jgi:hypothetical protein
MATLVILCGGLFYGILVWGMLSNFPFCAFLGVASFTTICLVILKTVLEQANVLLYHLRKEIKETTESKQPKQNFQSSFEEFDHELQLI